MLFWTGLLEDAMATLHHATLNETDNVFDDYYFISRAFFVAISFEQKTLFLSF